MTEETTETDAEKNATQTRQCMELREQIDFVLDTYASTTIFPVIVAALAMTIEQAADDELRGATDARKIGIIAQAKQQAKELVALMVARKNDPPAIVIQ